MPELRIDPDLTMHYVVDSYVDPWRKPETVVLLHGLGESEIVWYAWVPHLAKDLESCVRKCVASRLGNGFPSEGIAWWAELMGRTDMQSQIGFMRTIECADIRDDLPRIECPTLVITPACSGVASVEETRSWQRSIPNAELLVLPGNSYHVAASDADRCAIETLAFIRRAGVHL